MVDKQYGLLRFVALLFLLPGLAGLIVSATVSIHYQEVLPKLPIQEQSRMTPRNIHGTVVYQTKDEDRWLTFAEDTSVGVFLVGLGFGLVYLRLWGVPQAISNERDQYKIETS